MKFSIDQSKVRHMARNKYSYSERLQGAKLTVTTQERDPGFTVHSSMKISAQCQQWCKE